MDCITVLEARHLKDHQIWVRFNTGESGEADLRDIIYKFPIAVSLREPAEFAKFHLDDWPTLAWKCGFQLAPEYLYELVTGKVTFEPTSEPCQRTYT